jgi:hypothetical protein
MVAFFAERWTGPSTAIQHCVVLPQSDIAIGYFYDFKTTFIGISIKISTFFHIFLNCENGY